MEALTNTPETMWNMYKCKTAGTEEALPPHHQTRSSVIHAYIKKIQPNDEKWNNNKSRDNDNTQTSN